MTMNVSIPSPGNIVSIHESGLKAVSGPIRFIRLAAIQGGWIPKSTEMRRLFKSKDPNP